MLPGFLYDFCLYIIGGTKFEYLLINRQICVDRSRFLFANYKKSGILYIPI